MRERSLLETAIWRLLAPAAVGVFTGAVVGTLAALFEDRGLRALSATPGIIVALVSPLALLLTLAVVRVARLAGKPSGSELFIATVHDRGRLAASEVPGRVLAAISTVGLGGSQGFEAASALIGAATGDAVGRARTLAPPADAAAALMSAGASAGIAAVFSSPAVGLLYGLEVPWRRDLDARHLVPAAVAAACAYGTRVAVAGAHPLLTVTERPQADLPYFAGCVLIGIICGLGGRAFALAQARLQRAAHRGPALPRVAAAGAILGLLAWAAHALSGSWITLGPGHFAVDWLLGPGASGATGLVATVLVLRTAGTLVCVYGGGGGGVFTALACTGAFIGVLLSRALALDETQVLALIGAASFLSAGYRIPLCCMLWVGEASGDLAFTLGGAVAVAVAQVFAGNASVSDAKRDTRDTDF